MTQTENRVQLSLSDEQVAAFGGVDSLEEQSGSQNTPLKLICAVLMISFILLMYILTINIAYIFL